MRQTHFFIANVLAASVLEPAIEESCKRPNLFSNFATNNIALYNSLFPVEAIFQRDVQIE